MCAMMAMSTDGGGLGCMQIQLINAQSSPQGLASSSGQHIHLDQYQPLLYYIILFSIYVQSSPQGPQSKILGLTHPS